MNDRQPLDLLITALAYLMKGDGEVSAAERDLLMAILNKHVEKKELEAEKLMVIVGDALTQANTVPIKTFAKEAAEQLTPGQKMSIYANLFDMALADGVMRSGEKVVLDVIRVAFEIDIKITKAMMEILVLKNDTSIFSNAVHPHNEPDYKPRVIYNPA